jgi:hypothetical protein
MIRRIICDRSLLGLPKGIHQKEAELKSRKYDGFLPVFTDRFCIDGTTGCAVFLPNEVAKYRSLDDASNFTAELHAIDQALLQMPSKKKSKEVK